MCVPEIRARSPEILSSSRLLLEPFGGGRQRHVSDLPLAVREKRRVERHVLLQHLRGMVLV